jgi:hypothetical protein
MCDRRDQSSLHDGTLPAEPIVRTCVLQSSHAEPKHINTDLKKKEIRKIDRLKYNNNNKNKK